MSAVKNYFVVGLRRASFIVGAVVCISGSARAFVMEDPVQSCTAQVAQKRLIDGLMAENGELYTGASEGGWLCKIGLEKGTITGVGDNINLAVRALTNNCGILYAGIYKPGNCSAISSTVRENPKSFCIHFQSKETP